MDAPSASPSSRASNAVTTALGGLAFGAPGIGSTFSAGDKDLVSTSLGSSRVWVTIGGGVINEVFWPTTGRPQLRDLGFIVTGTGFWSEVKRNASYTITTPDPAVPIPTIVHRHERFELTLQIVCDPDRDCVVIRHELVALQADPSLQLHVLVAPHCGGKGQANDAWLDGETLHACRNAEHLALVASPPILSGSAGYVGHSDGWQDIAQHGQPTWKFQEALDGNVALLGTLSAHTGSLALAFATTARGARTLARGSLMCAHESLVDQAAAQWTQWAASLPRFSHHEDLEAIARTSAMVLRCHEDVTYPGAIVASLATPWGFAHNDPGGYHLVWPRDCAETGLGLAAIGMTAQALRTAEFLASTQLPDGSWPQNFNPGGEPYWTGRQLDETALPVLLVCKLIELGVHGASSSALAEMVRRAAQHLALAGPYTDQDRWEETSGASPFTVAATVSALVAAAESGLLDRADAAYARSLADWWNGHVESMTYVSGSGLDDRYGTAGHYVRIGRPEQDSNRGSVMLANRAGEMFETDELVGLEFLALVRFGLRRPDDPRIKDTAKIIDGELRVNSPAGPLFYRYQHDGYGEHADGAPFDGTGVGRPWPLLAGERGHYALDCGEDPLIYLRAMAGAVSCCGLIPEQVWDQADIEERRLTKWRPSGSATPLVWAHSEFLKLMVARSTGVRADRLDAVAGRYLHPRRVEVAHARGEATISTDAPVVLIEAAKPFRLHYGVDDWSDPHDVDSRPLGLGRHGVRLRRSDVLGSPDHTEFEIPAGATSVVWTVFDPATSSWEGHDHTVTFA